jgi:hypothetical protein
MIQWSQPEWVVISGGRSGDRAQAVTKSFQAGGAEVLHTYYDGAVRFIIKPDQLEAAYWTGRQWQVESASRGLQARQ